VHPEGAERISIVVPVFDGSATLPGLIDEIERWTVDSPSPQGTVFRVDEVLLVWDGGSAASAETVRKLAEAYTWVRGIWLSRNFGQHAATLAGMSSSGGTWVVTMDEDGQHDPALIGSLLDTAVQQNAQLVYAAPTNQRPHGLLRNAGSAFARWFFRRVTGDTAITDFHSFRLINGEVARGTAAYTGPGVYLDVALSWVVARVATCPLPMRIEGRAASNYSTRRLLNHFGRLLISSGTRPLMWVSVIGFVFFTIGVLYSIWVVANRLFGETAPEGWTSSFIATLIVGGLILFSLGIIAQYLRAAVNMSLGKPLYVVVKTPPIPPHVDSRT
jgi:glycosyltransferase involved in cell wall biosynthesis